MPIIVDEVVISVEVGEGAQGGKASAGMDPDAKQAIVAECVERVLDVLAQKEER